MIVRLTHAAVAIGILATTVGAQTNTKTGTTAAQFLKISVHARSMAMGEATAAAVSDVGSIHSNPAGLSRYHVQEVVFSQMQWFAGMQHFHFAGSMDMGSAGVIGVQLTTLDYGEEAVTTVARQDGTGEFWTAQDVSLGLAYSRNLTNTFSMGAQFKYLNSRIWHMSSSAVAVDLGTLFLTPFYGIRLGMAITNFGTKMTLAGRNTRFFEDPDETMSGNNGQIPAIYELSPWSIPLTFRVGLSGELIDTQQLRLSWAIDALHPSDNSEYLDLGTELALGRRLFLRTGVHGLFMVDDEQGRLSFGGGIHHSFSPSLRVKIDYAWVDHVNLNPVNMLSFSIDY